MGVSATCHIEIKVKGRDEWLHYNQPRLEQDYRLFMKLAGVRPENFDDIKPISDPKGLPDDVSPTVQISYDYEVEDAHGVTWLDSKEIAELIAWGEEDDRRYGHSVRSIFEAQFGFLFGNSLDIHAFPQDKPNFLEDVRIICWFRG